MPHAASALHIFRPGRHTALGGATLEFSAADLAATAAAYDPARHEAPLVVGHPALDAPAYGWVGALRAAPAGLEAEPRQVDPAFAEAVTAGRYKKISASFFLPDAPNNPAPGVYYLRHVGFLGAAPPAVKGLRPVAFSGDAGAVTLEFAAAEAWPVRNVFRALREWLLEKFGAEAANQVVPEYALDSIEAAPQPEAAATPAFSGPAAFAAAPNGDDSMSDADKQRLTALEAENARLKAQGAEFAAREARLAAQEDAARRAEIASFADGLVSAGRLLPRDRDGLAAYLAGPGASGVIEFGAGDARQSLPAAGWLREFLARLPVQVDFAERGAAPAAPASAAFAAPEGYAVDPAGAELRARALVHAAAHNTDFITAVQAVTAAPTGA